MNIKMHILLILSIFISSCMEDEQEINPIEIYYPENGDTISGTVTIQTERNYDFNINYVRFLVDDEDLGYDDNTPYRYEWDTHNWIDTNMHIIVASAYSGSMNQDQEEFLGSSTPIGVYVVDEPDEAKPSISIISPSDGDIISNMVLIQVSASDNVGISSVEFYVDGTKIGEDTTPSNENEYWEYIWDTSNYNPGSHKIEVRATDLSGNINEKEISVSLSISFKLYGDYTYNGDVAEFVVDDEATNALISFDGSPEIIIDPSDYSHSIELILNNLSITDAEQGINYSIDSVNVEEYRNENWYNDIEFVSFHELITEIAIILVLDVSNSLGEDFNNVKEYAKDFVNIIKTKSPDAQIGVVAFSTEYSIQPLTTDQNTITGFINNLSQDQYTSMYDAMSAAIDMIHPDSIDVEARAIVTFTDGHDNLSTSTASDIISALLTNSIKSYTMGLDGEQWGGVDSDILDQLALVTHEQGESYIVNSVEALSEAFDTFAKSVSNVYKVTYRRNNQQIIDPLQFKFILNCY